MQAYSCVQYLKFLIIIFFVFELLYYSPYDLKVQLGAAVAQEVEWLSANRKVAGSPGST